MDSKYVAMTSKNRSFLPVLGHGPCWLNRSLPPSLHVTACMTGGLKRLMTRLSNEKKGSKYEEEEEHAYGTYTDADGVFCPEAGMPLLASRYRFLEIIGKGQSSVLIKASDKFCGDKCVAIKLLHAHYIKLGPQEVDCMRRLNMADPYDVSSTLRLKNVFTFDKHYSIVFELLYARPLADIFSSIPKHEVIPCLRKVAKNLLKALGFLQQQGVIHADLKPENLLLQKKGDLNSLKVVDFGNAIRCIHEELSLYYDDYELQTLLYRSPEVMFGLTFGLEVDMWSFGCILAELFMKKPLFPGRDKKQVMEKIVSILGPVPEDLCMSGKFYAEFKHYTSKKTKTFTTSDMMKVLGCQDYAYADFVTKLLKYRPSDRMTIQQAACHPFLAAELGTSFFLSPGDRNMYSPLHLDSKAYGKGPFVSSEIKRLHLDSRTLLRHGTCKAGSSVVFKADPVIKFEPKKVAEVLPMQRTNGVSSSLDSNKRRKTQSSSASYQQNLNAAISFHMMAAGGNSSSSAVSEQTIEYQRSATMTSSASEDCEIIDLTVSPEPALAHSNYMRDYRNVDGSSDTSPYVPDQTIKFFPSSASCSSASASRDCDREQALPSETNSFHTTSDTMMSWPNRPSPNAAIVSAASNSIATSSRPHNGGSNGGSNGASNQGPLHGGLLSRGPLNGGPFSGGRLQRNLSLMLRPSSTSTNHHNALSEDSNSPVSTPDKMEAPNLISDSSPGGDSSVSTPHHTADPTMRNRPLKKRIRRGLFPDMPETPTDEPSIMPLFNHSSRDVSSRDASSGNTRLDINLPSRKPNIFTTVLSNSSISCTTTDTNQSRKKTITESLEKPYNGFKTYSESSIDQNHNFQPISPVSSGKDMQNHYFQPDPPVSSGKSRCKRQKVEPDSTQSSREGRALPDSNKGLCSQNGSPDIGRNSQCDESLVVCTPVIGRKRSSRKNGSHSGKHSGGKSTSKGKKGKNQIPRTKSAGSSGTDEVRLL